uniref:Putative secreted protein n=1 Tax=Anopheles marajoara TaxID=58244 RepID=A0A2M4CDQ1_9DIPT
MIVRSGSVSITWHVCSLVHGVSSVHGLTHRLRMQACCERHSLSMRHSGSGTSSRWHSTYGLPRVFDGHSQLA